MKEIYIISNNLKRLNRKKCQININIQIQKIMKMYKT